MSNTCRTVQWICRGCDAQMELGVDRYIMYLLIVALRLLCRCSRVPTLAEIVRMRACGECGGCKERWRRICRLPWKQNRLMSLVHDSSWLSMTQTDFLVCLSLRRGRVTCLVGTMEVSDLLTGNDIYCKDLVSLTSMTADLSCSAFSDQHSDTLPKSWRPARPVTLDIKLLWSSGLTKN